MKKLKAFLLSAQISLSPKQEAALQTLQQLLTEKRTEASLAAVYGLMSALLKRLPAANLFPALDLLRLLVLLPAPNTFYSSHGIASSPSLLSLVSLLSSALTLD